MSKYVKALYIVLNKITKTSTIIITMNTTADTTTTSSTNL